MHTCFRQLKQRCTYPAAMASQPDDGIPLFHTQSEVGYKLLELPPELVELLEGEDPPT
jgi:sister chromatid cohesion protein DCC1